MATKRRATNRKPKMGDCYEAAGKYILSLSRLYMADGSVGGDEGGAEGLVLVHAEVAGQGPMEGLTFGHAFVYDPEKDLVIDRSNGRNIQLPRPLYYAIGQVEEIGNYHEYTPTQMMERMIQHMHWGPWELKTRSGL